MKPLTYFDVAGQQIATHPVQVLKLECRGGDSLASGAFWQVHDSASVPAEGAVPAKSWPAYTGAPDYKDFKDGELNLVNGCYVCISTTEATKTLGTGNNKFASLLAELTDPEQPSGTTIVGDRTTNVEDLQVWAQAASPKRLVSITTTNAAGQECYLQIHATDTPSTESLVESFSVADGITKKLSFGKDGRTVQKIVGGVLRTGCKLAYSTAKNTYEAAGAQLFKIQAEYK